MRAESNRNESYFVRPREGDASLPAPSSHTDTLTFPSGQTVHALERGVFDAAVKAATKKE